MKRVYLADGYPDERSALRLLLMDLNLKIVGEAADWQTVFAQAPVTRPDMLVVDWGLVNGGPGSSSLMDLRRACSSAVVIVLISHLEAREQAAVSAGADAFISKGETAERIVERLKAAVGSLGS